MARSGHAVLAALAGSVGLLAACGAKSPPPAPVGKMPVWLKAADPRKPLARNELAFRWYGTAAFAVRTARTTVFFDPYFTRDPLWKLATGPARPRPDRWPEDLPEPDAIFIGHAHFDHFLDAPEFAKRTGATLHASAEALRVARAEGTPDKLLRPIQGGDEVKVGDITVEVATSSHSEIATQALVGGSMPERPKMPMWFHSYKNGPVFTFLLKYRGRGLAHISSAQIRDEYFEGKADVALVCLSGWRWTPSLFARLYEAIGPDVVVPMHHDDFFRPLSAGFSVGPVTSIPEAYAQIQQDMPGTAIVPMEFFQEFRITGVEGI